MKKVKYSICTLLFVVAALIASVAMPSDTANAASSFDNTVNTAPNFVMSCAGSSQTEDWANIWYMKAKQAETDRKITDSSFETPAMDYYESSNTNIMLEMWASTSPYGAFTMFIANPEATISFGGHSFWSQGIVFHNLTELKRVTLFTNTQSGDPSKDGCAPANLARAVGDDTLVENGVITGGGGSFMSMGSGDIFYPTNPVYQFINLPITYPQDYEGSIIPSLRPQPSITYVAMGDSFSSGEGNPSFEVGTDTSSNECHRSSLAYPRLLQNDSSLNLGSAAFVACSGATVKDLLGQAETDDPLGKWNEPAQIDALSDKVKVVTITIGGNDIGFKQFMTNCTLAWCGPGSPVYNTTRAKINQALRGDIADAYRTTLQKSGDSKLFVLAYPYLVGSECTTFDAGNDIGVWDMTNALNSLIVDAINDVKNDSSHPAYASRISYIPANSTDNSSPFDGRYLCNDNPYFWDLDLGNEEYSYHPNHSGHQAYKELVKAALS